MSKDQNCENLQQGQPVEPQVIPVENLDEASESVEAKNDVKDKITDTSGKSSPDQQDNADSAVQDQEITTESVVEAILFAADEPVTAKKLVEIIGAGGVREVKKHIKNLNDKYTTNGNAFRIEEIAGGFQLLTQSQYNPWLAKLIKVRSETKLTPASLETLAIIAYKQPLMRVDIENIRGVAAGEMVRQLIDKGVVKIVGRAEELGRPLLYGTTKKFLEVFGLNNLKDLPVNDDERRDKPAKEKTKEKDALETKEELAAAKERVEEQSQDSLESVDETSIGDLPTEEIVEDVSPVREADELEIIDARDSIEDSQDQEPK